MPGQFGSEVESRRDETEGIQPSLRLMELANCSRRWNAGLLSFCPSGTLEFHPASAFSETAAGQRLSNCCAV